MSYLCSWREFLIYNTDYSLDTAMRLLCDHGAISLLIQVAIVSRVILHVHAPYQSLAQREKELSGKTKFFELGAVLNCLQKYLDTQNSKLHIFFKYLKNETQNNFSHCNIYNIQTQKAYYLSLTKAPDSSLSRWAVCLCLFVWQLNLCIDAWRVNWYAVCLGQD